MQLESNDMEKGIITRIYLEHFVTYNRVVIKPGRNLNVIIGPNGTGKSTIVCAIVLGLGGDVDLLGRARHLKDYIKNGCKEAKIEIELKESDNSNVVITRIFSSDKSTWLLNGKLVSSKIIYDVIADFNIQVENLCQFLPQDKIQDFSKMNSQELLENTEKSVGDPMLIKLHIKLKHYRYQHKTLETLISTKKNLLESQIQKYNGFKEIVGNIKERKMIKEKIISLKQKKAWIIYDQTRKQCKKSKEKRDAAAVKMDKLKAQLYPIDQEISKLNSHIKRLKDCTTYCNRQISVKTLEIENTIIMISDYETMIKEYESECQRKIQAEQTRDEEINMERQHKNKIEMDLSHMINEVVSENMLLREQRSIICQIQIQRGDITSLTEQCNTLRQREEHLSHAIKVKEDELQFCSIEAKRLELLKQISADAYKGVLWLKENENRFSAPIHEPMLLHINVKNFMYAKYLETSIPVRDLLAFICENKQDMNLLLKYLRDRLRLQVNVVHSDPLKEVYMQPNIPLKNIKQFGFNYYLVSLIDAPNTIIKYLVSMYNLHNIPVGSKAVDDNVAHIPQSLPCYFSENNVYSVSISKYSAEKSTQISTVTGNGLLSIILDTSKIEKITKKIQVFKEERNKIINKIKTFEDTISKTNEELDNNRAMKNKCQQNIQQIQALKSRIHMAEEKITILNNERTSIEEIKASTTSDIQASINKQLNVSKQYKLLLQEHFNIVTDAEEKELSLMVYQRCLVKQENSVRELREEYLATEQEFIHLDIELVLLKNEAKKLYNEALNLSNGISPQDPGFKPLNAIFAKLPTTIEEINKELNTVQAKAFCMANNVDGENILREYEEIESDIVRLKEAIQAKTSKLMAKFQKMENLREQWLEPLKHLITQINLNFSSHFETMKCAGEVTLHHGENIMDFNQYGLKIKVKFRDGDELQELTRYHQSGGERAVTTAIYMIALQELSTVPFRCVDEINQGMDAVNERRVFELLVKITGKPQSSQYFLLTPKLLPGLLYSDTVTVHCVFNGPFMIPDTEFDLQQFCTQINQSVNRTSVGNIH